jgi:hypothetical protein
VRAVDSNSISLLKYEAAKFLLRSGWEWKHGNGDFPLRAGYEIRGIFFNQL